jgi:hypothetical protein
MILYDIPSLSKLSKSKATPKTTLNVQYHDKKT